VVTGFIERSLDGVSYGAGSLDPADSGSFDDCIALLEAANVDSVTPVSIGWLRDQGPDSAAAEDFEITAGESLMLSPPIIYRQDRPPAVHRYQSALKMQLDLEAGKIDGYLSYKPYSGAESSLIRLESPAPYYAALLPNPRSRANERGFLTTSLYYRYDPFRLSLMFKGNHSEPLFGISGKDSVTRTYEFNPDKGKRLMKQCRLEDHTVRIDVGSRELYSVVAYYADVLSREQIRVAINPEMFDASIMFVPYCASDPSVSIAFIHRLVSDQESSGGALGEALQLVDSYLKAAKDSASSRRFLSLAEQTLVEDIGVFSLFRPVLHFVARSSLTGVSFDQSGLLDLSSAALLERPVSAAGTVERQ
jgi:hypothetical protein